MEEVKVSTKFQLVLPKKARRKMGIVDSSLGYTMRVKRVTETEITFERVASWRDFVGKFEGAWGVEPVKTIRKIRDTDWE